MNNSNKVFLRHQFFSTLPSFCLEIDQPETRIAYGGQVYRIGTKRVIFV
jgi:hypothetical protein